MYRRWGKIEKDFYTKNKTFDISKIPDIYDCIKYDLQHNQHTIQFEQAEELYVYAKYLADIVIPQVRFFIIVPIKYYYYKYECIKLVILVTIKIILASFLPFSLENAKSMHSYIYTCE